MIFFPFFSYTATNWKFKRDAIVSLTEVCSINFVRKCEHLLPAILVIIIGHTKNFKESSFNLMKAITDFFQAVRNVHIELCKILDFWICKFIVPVSIEKISDRKFINIAGPLLSSSCIVRIPTSVLQLSIKA